MISEPCLSVTQPMTTLAEKVKAFIVIATAKAQDGLTVAEFGELFLALMRLAIETVDGLTVPGADKKQMVLDALAQLFDELADRAVPLYMWPIWAIARPAVRAAVLAAASGGIEIVLQMVRKQK